MTIGILDIFGFEIFKYNSLEQLFINFANERLQGLYIDYIFKNECKIFIDEGFGQYTSLIIYKDNKPVIDSLECSKQPPGVFDLLDQMSVTNKTDKEFFNEVQKAHKGSHLLAYPKIFKDEKDYNFSVKHTARDVTYYVLDFVDKNTEELQTALIEALKTCSSDIYGVFNENLCLPSQQVLEAPINQRKQTLSLKFRKSMDELVKQLASCNCHFVRCIKPNELKKSDFWNPLLVLQQVRYMGLLDSLKIRKNSFPFRFTYANFFEIFQDLDSSPNGTRNYRTLVRENANFESLTKEALKNCGIDFTVKDLLFGKTRIFLNEKLKVDLEKALLLKQKQKKQALVLLQTIYRSFLMKLIIKHEVTRHANVISLSRDFLCSWNAKAESLKFKKFLYFIRRIQLRFRRVVQKRQNRLKSFNMLMIIKHLALYKFNVKVQYLYYFKNKIKMLSDMLERKMKESKIRYCRSIVEKCVNSSWANINVQKEKEMAITLQRTFRSHLLRLAKLTDIQIFNKKLLDSRTNYAAKNIQKTIRGFLVRRRLARLIRAASKIKGLFKTRWIRSYFLRIRSAVKLIQRNLKKYLIRKSYVEKNGREFEQNHGTMIESIRRLEHSILFGDSEHLTNLGNVEDYVKMSFYEHSSLPDFGTHNFKLFLPKPSKLDNQPRLFILPIDLNVHADSTCIYHQTWSGEFVEMMRKIEKKNQRLIHVEVGETFTVAVTDENDFYTWGLNDYNQCGFKLKKKSSSGQILQETEGFYFGENKNKNLSGFVARSISASKDQAFLIEEGNNLIAWGRCDENQFGYELNNQTGIFVMNNIPVSLKGVVARESLNYILGLDGKVYTWSNKNLHKSPLNQTYNRKVDPQLVFKVSQKEVQKESKESIQYLSFGQEIKISSIVIGTDFSLFLSDQGHVYSFGKNEFGQLGLGHMENIAEPHLIKDFKNKNVKIVEISAGHKHFIAKTNMSNVYTCGYNGFGQLGSGDIKNRMLPFLVKVNNNRTDLLNSVKVQAGFDCSLLLMSNKQVWLTGKSGLHKSTEQSNFFTRLMFEFKVC